jgi:tetratricopeptide (TPR) repeat protein
MTCRAPDRRSVLVTTSDPVAVAALDAAILGLATHRASTASALVRALELDPALVPALVLQGFAAKLLARGDLVQSAELAVSRARASLDARGGTRREHLLTRALELWCAEDPIAALAVLDASLADEPLDLLALKLGHALSFLVGRTDAMRRSVERVLPEWERFGAEGLGPVLGCHAFALEETGELEAAEAVGRRALRIEPRDAWGAHAVAHVLHASGRVEDGLAWLDEVRGCLEGANNFAGHVWWHRALMMISAGRADEALALHDSGVAPHLGRDYRDLVNSATLLYRLERVGVDVGARWDALADLAMARIGEHLLGFPDVHHVLALVGARRIGDAERFVRSMQVRALGAEGTEATVLRDVAVPAARAFVLLGRDPARARDLLVALEPELGRLGGSRAQREIFGLVRADAEARLERSTVQMRRAVG